MKIMAVDLGDSRTGLATCDKFEMLASPLEVIHEKNIDVVLKQVSLKAKENGIELLVVGYPKNMNGTVGERAEKCAAFAEKLEKKSGIKTVLWDERSTTVSATNYLNVTNTRGQKRKNVIDAVAATIILESYLNYRKLNG